jgi:hypothetical protein
VARIRTPRWQRLAHCAQVDRFLSTLLKEGMVWQKVLPNGRIGYYLTAAGRRLLDE